MEKLQGGPTPAAFSGPGLDPWKGSSAAPGKPREQSGSKANCWQRYSLLLVLEKAARQGAVGRGQSAMGRGQRAAGKGTQSLRPPTSRPSCDSRWRWSG